MADKTLSGGLNSTAGPFGLKDNESSDLQNIDFDQFGSILKRNGYSNLNSVSTTVRAAAEVSAPEPITFGFISRRTAARYVSLAMPQPPGLILSSQRRESAWEG